MMRTRGAMEAQSALPQNWAEMTPEEKRRYRLKSFASTEGKKFVSPEAEKNYKIRAQRMVDVFDLKEPDRVPVSLPVGNLPLLMAGLNSYDAMYNHEKILKATQDFNDKYSEELEHYAGAALTPGKALEMLDYKIYSWPGHGIPESSPGWQYIEGEYMTVDEYDDLIRDPTDFWIRTYLPRTFGALEPFRIFQPFTNITENVHTNQLTVPLSMPSVQAMLQKMIDVGNEARRVQQIAGASMGGGVAHGYPVVPSIFCKAPFDIIGDTLRGTSGIMYDMFRRPAKLLKALDVIADVMIANVLKAPGVNNAVMVGYPLHKGADGWMSQKQFDTFYWPSLKKVMDAYIQEGLIQRHFAEGGYETRLETVNVFPKGFVTWHFDKTDMFLAKKVIGDNCCIQGNVPSSLIISGNPKDTKEYCRKLIEGCAPGGGFILTAGCVGTDPKLENLQAMMAAVKEYGVYKKKK